VARLVGAAPEDIALVDSATTAWQAIFYSIPFRAGDRILTCRTEYTSNAIAYLHVARRTGAVVEFVPDDEHGQLDVAALRERVDERVKLIAVTHVPSNSGLVNPVEEVGLVAERAGVPYLVDACQSAGQLDLDVKRLRCDALSATGRKFLRAPRGTGFLYVGQRLRAAIEPSRLDMRAADWIAPGEYRVRADARQYETWESNTAARLGLGAAVDYALELGLPAIERRVGALAEHLRTALATIPGVRVEDRGVRRCGIVMFSIDNMPATEASRRLRTLGVNTSVSTATDAQYDHAERGLPDRVRASVHYYNTIAELDATVGHIKLLAG
jgi:selenocysteine lyase/cysteine desulfurase